MYIEARNSTTKVIRNQISQTSDRQRRMNTYIVQMLESQKRFETQIALNTILIHCLLRLRG